MGQPSVRAIQPSVAFQVIKEAFEDGREIVPLLGSGVSIDAGIPSAAHLVDHLVSVWAILQRKGWTDPRVYLQQYGWLGRHDAAEEWLRLFEKDNDSPRSASELQKEFEQAKRELYKLCITDEVRRHAPMAANSTKAYLEKILAAAASGSPGGGLGAGFTDYRSLLSYLTDRDSSLTDAYFDHFVRNRRPATIHQFVAFVIQLLNIQLVLTTNFDTLIEDALRDEGLRPTVYEVTREGNVPSNILVRTQRLAVVKLHGGTHSLRTGYDLDDRLPIGTLTELRDYLHPPQSRRSPLMLVIGYSGSDRRVMDVVNDHLGYRPHQDNLDRINEDETRVLWISRDGKPPDLLETAAKRHANEMKFPAKVCHYRDGRLFLQELFQVITRQHAVTQTHYEVLSHIPRRPQPDKPKLEKSLDDVSQHVFIPNADTTGTSNRLAREVDALASTHHVIWIDAAELRSRATLFVFIQEALLKQDRGLIQITRPLFLADVDYISRESPRPPADSDAAKREEKERLETDRQDLDLACAWIACALRRGHYVLAIDSIGEFAAHHPAMPGSQDATAPMQVAKAIEFLHRLYDQRAIYGVSHIMIAVTANVLLKKTWTPELIREAIVSGQGIDKLLKDCIPPAERKTKQQAENIDLSSDWDALVKQYIESAPGTQGPDLALAPLLALASCCRRSRSLTALHTQLYRAYKIWKANPQATLTYFSACFVAICKRIDDKAVNLNIDVDSASRQVCNDIINEVELEHIKSPESQERTEATESAKADSKPLPKHVLFRMEGGFYWMHLAIRDAMYRYFTRSAPAGEFRFTDSDLSMLYDSIADFAHDDLFERSQDASAFVEYMFYRTASLKFARPNEYVARLNWLVSTIEQEKEKMLARGRLTAVLNLIRSILQGILPGSQIVDSQMHARTDDDRMICQRLTSRLLACYGDVLIACGRPGRAMQYRVWQLKSQVDNKDVDLSLDKQTPATVLEIVRTVTTQGIAPESRIRVADALVDLATSAGDPILFVDGEELNSSVGSNQGVPKDERRCRHELVSECLNLASTLIRLDATNPNRDAEEMWARIQIRSIEHELREFGHTRFCFQEIAGSTPENQAELKRKSAAMLDRCSKALTVLRGAAPTSRRRRHKCYLYLLKARINVQLCGDFDHARVFFRRAEASISRLPGASERTALAMVLLFEAEAKLIQAMVSHGMCLGGVIKHGTPPKHSANQNPESNAAPQDVAKADAHSLRLVRHAELLLEQADAALVEGRVENRWRVFLYTLRAKSALLEVQFGGKMEVSVQRSHLRKAIGHITNGLINTGRGTDQRLVCLLQWERAAIDLVRLRGDAAETGEKKLHFVPQLLKEIEMSEASIQLLEAAARGAELDAKILEYQAAPSA